jgi:glutamate formiminotransferase / 5-formyltetrahydrofolate cyclo-ligase
MAHHDVFECVINVSEGQDEPILRQFERSAGSSFRHRHSDPWHNRSVFTLINSADELLLDVQWMLRNVIDALDLEFHDGVHPRFGVVDVVPFVALDPTQRHQALALRNHTAEWLGDLGVSTFLYGDVDGTERTLPEVRAGAFVTLTPDFGPVAPDEEVGATAVGERPVLLAWNMVVEGVDLAATKRLAGRLRRPGIRTLGLAVGSRFQVSCNLIEPLTIGPGVAYDALTALLPEGASISTCELVGLAPRAVLETINPKRWMELGLSEELTIEAHLGTGALRP